MRGKQNSPHLPPHPLPPDGSEILILLLDNTEATFHLEQKRINFLPIATVICM
jgi:hypothetical protein